MNELTLENVIFEMETILSGAGGVELINSCYHISFMFTGHPHLVILLSYDNKNQAMHAVFLFDLVILA